MAVLFANSVMAQGKIIVKYYDAAWVPVAKEKAVYYTEFVKQDTFYKCTSRWTGSGKLKCTSTYADTEFIKGIGMLMRYYEDSRVEDSLLFNNSGQVAFQFHYAQNGKLGYHAYYNKPQDKVIGENYDTITGKRLPGVVTFLENAKFPGGPSAWVDYLSSHLKAKVPVKNGAKAGLYTVIVTFLVDKDGKISDVEAATDPGFGTAEEAVRVVKNGPKWIPAIQNNQAVVYRQKQSITFSVSDERN